MHGEDGRGRGWDTYEMRKERRTNVWREKECVYISEDA